jgi:ribosome-associated translation inhibitor RaiA
MQTPLRITFRHMRTSPAVEALVREHVERLERFHDRITGCHVVVEAPPAHRNKGADYTRERRGDIKHHAPKQT